MSSNDGGDKVLSGKLIELEDDGKVETYQPDVTYHQLYMSDEQTNCGGPPTIHFDDEMRLWCMEDLSLGPRNMLKVIAFLQQLPAEPDEDGWGHRCGVTDTVLKGGWWAWIECPGEVDPNTIPRGMKAELVEGTHQEGFSSTHVGPFTDEEFAQDWLDVRNRVTRMKVPKKE